MNRPSVTPAAPVHHDSLVELLLELHAHHVDPPTATREAVRSHLMQNLLAGAPSLCLLVASNEAHEVLGLAALVLLYSLVEPTAAARRQCVLKELYVRSTHRSAGIGRLLVQGAARFAVDNGCGRMDWNVKASNLAGIRFYKSLGGVQVEDRLSYRLTRTQLEALSRVA